MKEEYYIKAKSLQSNLKYYFNDIDLLLTSLTHSSFANENDLHPSKSNQRLEFLGDTVLNLVVSEYLYNKYPFYPEGELSKIRSKVVCESSLAIAARKINLGDYILLGKGEILTGGKERESILADTCEAIIGAIFLDSDYKTTYDYLINNFEADIIKEVAKGNLFKDYKTEIQEKLQKITKDKIEYIVTKEEGPDHKKIFYVDLRLNGDIIGQGIGRSKKEAEQMAAKEALILLEDDYE
ncbi:MAG: ribonuclease III [Tissierellales bacterium]|nr:ribonuclease III [Tissierellales bacterium]